jgi:transcriptional regulator with XRE-family HTH domain
MSLIGGTVPFNPLAVRRRQLGMSVAALAARSGVPVSTVKRVLNGGLEKASFENVVRIASALGLRLDFRPAEDALAMQRREAERKARRIVRLVQGTSALEAQAVDEKSLSEMRQRTVHELMAGSKRRLWDP